MNGSKDSRVAYPYCADIPMNERSFGKGCSRVVDESRSRAGKLHTDSKSAISKFLILATGVYRCVTWCSFKLLAASTSTSTAMILLEVRPSLNLASSFQLTTF